MATDASKSRSSCCNFLLWLLNLSLLALAAAGLGPVLLLRPRPTLLGWALVSLHAVTLLSALASLYALLTRRHRHLCCGRLPAPAALAVAALCGHALALCALVIRHDRSLVLLGSQRDRRVQFVLLFLEEALLLGMFLVQALALAAACVVSRRWAREHQAARTEKAAARRDEEAGEARASGGRA